MAIPADSQRRKADSATESKALVSLLGGMPAADTGGLIKQHLLSQVKRCANGGAALGATKLEEVRRVLAVLREDGKLGDLKEAAAAKLFAATAKAARAEAARNYTKLCTARPEPLHEMQISADQMLAKPQFTADPQGAFICLAPRVACPMTPPPPSVASAHLSCGSMTAARALSRASLQSSAQLSVRPAVPTAGVCSCVPLE